MFTTGVLCTVCGAQVYLECRILKIHSFPQFPLTGFDILSWNFAFHFVLLYYRSSSSVVNLSYAPFGTQNTRNPQFSAIFSYMLWHIELKFCIWLCLTILQIKFDCRQFASIFVGVMPLLVRKMMKYTVFGTFLLHALTYWAEILNMTLFYCTSDQV